jgi:hypothetical protein
MKKKFIFLGVLLVFLLVLTGCSSSVVGTVGSNNNSTTTQRGAGGRQLDFGQPDRQADLRGVVTAVVGNEVSVLKIALNSGRRASSTPANAGDASTTQNAPSISLGGVAGGAGASRGGGGGFIGGGGRGGAGGPGGAASGQDRAAMLEQLKAMSTGQETIIIPVGIKMMKFSLDSGTQKRTAVEANLTDVTTDKMITVWLNASVTDKKVAEFVLIN